MINQILGLRIPGQLQMMEKLPVKNHHILVKKILSTDTGSTKSPTSSIPKTTNKPPKSAKEDSVVKSKDVKSAQTNDIRSGNQELPRGNSIQDSKGEIKLKFTADECVKILKVLKKATLKNGLRVDFIVNYSNNWRVVHFLIHEKSTDKELYSFSIKKDFFIEKELDFSKFGNPTVNNRAHGINPRFFKVLINYAHDILADNLEVVSMFRNGDFLRTILETVTQ